MNSRAGKVLAVVVGVLVLLAVVAGVVSATRDRADLPAGSPEAVVQDYVAQVYDQDVDAALAHLAPDSGCTVEDLTRAYAEPATRVVLRSSDVDGDTATVRLDFVHGADGPFQSEWTQEETFRLARADSAADWAITGVPWPMPGCGKEWRP
jgi:hypothetical protein